MTGEAEFHSGGVIPTRSTCARIARTLAAATAAGAVLAAFSGGAHAALSLVFGGTEAAPGTLVTVQTAGRGALAKTPPSGPLRVFLAPAGAATEITSPHDDRLVLLGRLRVDAHGNGYLRFRVPSVPAGDYETFVHCPSCAQYSAGRTLLPTGPHPGSFVVLSDESGVPSALVALASAAGVAGIGGVAWFLKRRHVGGADASRAPL